MVYILFPGRHHLLTRFQHDYLTRIITNGLENEADVNSDKLGIKEGIEGIIFAVTSANHSNTRRNPLPLYLRAMALHEFSQDLGTKGLVFDIDDVGFLDGTGFPEYTLKRIRHKSGGRLALAPENTVVLCSTPDVLKRYEQLGFRILPAELKDRKTGETSTDLSWEVVEQIAGSDDWEKSEALNKKAHPSTRRMWLLYNIGDMLRRIFTDHTITEDGDLTSTRDYNSYVRMMDEIAEVKYSDTKRFIRPGRIGDIGCAVGSWIRLACADTGLRESDFYGVEISRQLFDECEHRKERGDFRHNPNVFFSVRNASAGLVFGSGSMDTIHFGSLGHEIISYANPEKVERIMGAYPGIGLHKAHIAAGEEQAREFLGYRLEELVHGGVFIDRDVVGPDNPDEAVYMELNTDDGRNDDYARVIEGREELAEYLKGLSTYARFLRFAMDFRKDEGYKVEYADESMYGKGHISARLGDACEFMSKKDYIENWKSEMHEVFCHWGFRRWKQEYEQAGFIVDDESRVFTNPWIVKNRLEGKIRLFRKCGDALEPMAYPETNMVIAGKKL